MLDILKHYGTPRHSGRYPWGSGEEPYQSSKNFLGYIQELKKEGLTEKEIAGGLGMSLRELRERRTIARNEIKKADIATAEKLKEKNYSNVAIGKHMGIPESSVRNLLAPSTKDRATRLDNTVNILKAQLDRNEFLDVGKGTERYLGVSEEHLNAALTKLKDEGYRVDKFKEPQVGTDHETTVVVLSPPGTTYKDVVTNKAEIGTVAVFSDDKGSTYKDVPPPKSVSSDRIDIRYGQEGGAAEDGLIYLRRGVDDISLGNKRYAQVRIAVDDTHFIKGVAVYKDDLPKGVDILFNTNKQDTGNKKDALKPLTEDPDLPFGSVTRPKYYRDSSGKEQQSALNIIYEEGEWSNWDKNLSSQVLSKQTTALASRQLGLDASFRQQELNEIKALTNPTIKKHLLMEFASGADAAAVDLAAAALPRQATSVIIPINSLKDNEIYAPNFKQGENVALIRFPHGGRFEIPELRVNNRNTEGRSLLSNNPIDAVGINSKVAAQLSGADFDGDTVLVIPNNDGKVKSSKPLQGLKDFNPQATYKRDKKTISAAHMQKEMGKVSNLITDMTIRGANNGEIARAVRHSMVVIDSYKHNLDYKQSAIDNQISELKAKYQLDPSNPKSRAASTIVSRASSEISVPKRKPRLASEGGPIDRDTGELRWTPTGQSYTKTNPKTGVTKTIPLTQKTTRLAEAKDAHSLSSGTPIEAVYANYSNRLKAMANDARKTAISTKGLTYSPQAAKTYAPQVASLTLKLDRALKNAPLERRAQLLTNAQMESIRRAQPELDKGKLRTISNKTLTEMRDRVGARKERIDITPLEWEAIQAGGVSNKFLEDIIRNTDSSIIKEYATPRSVAAMPPSKVSRARSMLNMGYTQAEVAEALGVSTSTLSSALNG